ncbi:hypothetical protein [Aquamicrobium zhengzhouense]|uniref:Lipoprotein n=1 Tax=Aquamicrobium zhengzhouense TaxID=2781738 RepID=A0ABS0S7N6_9HYPH|nr:hypothetical protein [Aquamicrobium zhengzhouense]MBI1619296.1 hypothetical protein [Aquamicrobium zhengzhouense]
MRILASAAIIAALAALAACQSKPSAPAQQGGKSSALRNMEVVAKAAHRCWFASGDAAFRSYSFANELNSFTGRPRFLLVPRGNFGGRPLLVVQAEGNAGQVSAFGPMLDGPTGSRVAGDVDRWRRGDQSCG